MGPSSEYNDLPKRPRFSWDIKTVPWTEGKGNQEDYATSVALWSQFHNKLPNQNSNKIPADLRGIMLQSQLYGRARDLCKKISAETIQSENGADSIVKAVYKRDPLSVVSEVYQDFTKLLATKRHSTESFKYFESRFEAQVSKFNAHSESNHLPDSLTAFMLLANPSVDNGERISVLAAAAPSSITTEDACTSDYLSAVTYNSVASVLRQCDTASSYEHNTSNSMRAHSANAHPSRSFRSNRPKRMLPPEKLAELKSRSICRTCKQKGHWHSDHNQDGSLKPGDLYLLKYTILPTWSGKLDPIPNNISPVSYWQYGSGQHASDSRKILGSVMLPAKTNEDTIIYICHLIIQGSSQWVIGRNVTKMCNIVHFNGNYIQIPYPDGTTGTISLTDQEYHSFVPYKVFCQDCSHLSSSQRSRLYCATAQFDQQPSARPWAELKKIVDKVHKHVCGHSSYSDIKILLQRNNLWNHEVMKYLSEQIETCGKCATTSLPKQSRKDGVVPDTSMNFAIEAIESQWISPFWAPEIVLFDLAFNNTNFKKYLSSYSIEPRPIPPRRHNKNVLESKHRVIRDVYLRLKAEHEDCSSELSNLLVQMLSVFLTTSMGTM
eukprot:IDg17605t1